MRKYAFAAIIGLVMTLSMAALPAHADRGHKGGSKDGDLESKFFWKASFLLSNQEEIGLTEEQITKIEQLQTDVKKSLIRKDAEIEVIALDIQSALKSDNADIEVISPLVDQKYDLKKQKTKDVIAAYVQLSNLLTEEQKAKKKALFSQKHSQKTSE